VVQEENLRVPFRRFRSVVALAVDSHMLSGRGKENITRWLLRFKDVCRQRWLRLLAHRFAAPVRGVSAPDFGHNRGVDAREPVKRSARSKSAYLGCCGARAAVECSAAASAALGRAQAPRASDL